MSLNKWESRLDCLTAGNQRSALDSGVIGRAQFYYSNIIKPHLKAKGHSASRVHGCFTFSLVNTFIGSTSCGLCLPMISFSLHVYRPLRFLIFIAVLKMFC